MCFCWNLRGLAGGWHFDQSQGLPLEGNVAAALSLTLLVHGRVADVADCGCDQTVSPERGACVGPEGSPARRS